MRSCSIHRGWVVRILQSDTSKFGSNTGGEVASTVKVAGTGAVSSQSLLVYINPWYATKPLKQSGVSM